MSALAKLPPRTKKVIAVSGKAGAGKDTIGDYLCQRHLFNKFSFAYPIRQIVKIALNLSDNQVYDHDLYNCPLPNFPQITLRKALQMVGTEMFRDMIDQDIWCKNLLHRARTCSNDLIVITDMRFPNEQEQILSHYPDSCLFIKVVRDGCDGTTGVKNHESESYDLHCDVTLENNGEKEELYKKVEDIIEAIKFNV
jgi:hypothetical protein